MLYFTFIYRQSDGLALASDSEVSYGDAKIDFFRVTAKNILRRLSAMAGMSVVSRPGIEKHPSGGAVNADHELEALASPCDPTLLIVTGTGSHYYIYFYKGVMYLTVCASAGSIATLAYRCSPAADQLAAARTTLTALAYLKDIATEFSAQYSSEQVQRASRSYGFVKFDSYLQKTRKLYLGYAASNNAPKATLQHIVVRSYNEVMGIPTETARNAARAQLGSKSGIPGAALVTAGYERIRNAFLNVHSTLAEAVGDEAANKILIFASAIIVAIIIFIMCAIAMG